MARRRSFSPKQIITKLRKAAIYLGQGETVKKFSKLLEISEQTYYRRQREYGGMDISQANKLKEMEKENILSKNLIAVLSLDYAILKGVLEKKIKSDCACQQAASCQAGSGNIGCLRPQGLPGH
jgi:putative transposase